MKVCGIKTLLCTTTAHQYVGVFVISHKSIKVSYSPISLDTRCFFLIMKGNWTKKWNKTETFKCLNLSSNFEFKIQWTYYQNIVETLLIFESCWTNLNLTEPIWTLLNFAEPIWTLLNLVEPIWALSNLAEWIWS